MTLIQPTLPSSEGLPAPDYDATVVHLASEYWPYARTGGLAEAVRGIARHQAAAGAVVAGGMALTMMPGRGEARPLMCLLRGDLPTNVL